MISPENSVRELPRISNDLRIDSLFERAIAVQLKSINSETEVSRYAFRQLCRLTMNQLDGMASELHRISGLQRRKQISEHDLHMFLRGFALDIPRLSEALQQSQHVTQKFVEDTKMLNDNANATAAALKLASPLSYGKSSAIEFQSDQRITEKSYLDANLFIKAANQLVPPSNELRNKVPHWLPDFPPDHTYKFTPQYNQPITSEIEIREKVFQEGSVSEQALLHLTAFNHIKNSNNFVDDHSEVEKAAHETKAVYYGLEILDHKRKLRKNGIDLSTWEKLNNRKRFDIQDYAKNKVEQARKKVHEHEISQNARNNNPLLYMTKMFYNPSVPKTQLHEEVKKCLKRSFQEILENIPELTKRRKAALSEAVNEREAILRNRLTEIQNQKHSNAYGEKASIDLSSELQGNSDMAFLDELENSTSDDDEVGIEFTATKDRDQFNMHEAEDKSGNVNHLHNYEISVNFPSNKDHTNAAYHETQETTHVISTPPLPLANNHDELGTASSIKVEDTGVSTEPQDIETTMNTREYTDVVIDNSHDVALTKQVKFE